MLSLGGISRGRKIKKESCSEWTEQYLDWTKENLKKIKGLVKVSQDHRKAAVRASGGTRMNRAQRQVCTPSHNVIKLNSFRTNLSGRNLLTRRSEPSPPRIKLGRNPRESTNCSYRVELFSCLCGTERDGGGERDRQSQIGIEVERPRGMGEREMSMMNEGTNKGSGSIRNGNGRKIAGRSIKISTERKSTDDCSAHR